MSCGVGRRCGLDLVLVGMWCCLEVGLCFSHDGWKVQKNDGVRKKKKKKKKKKVLDSK